MPKAPKLYGWTETVFFHPWNGFKTPVSKSYSWPKPLEEDFSYIFRVPMARFTPNPDGTAAPKDPALRKIREGAALEIFVRLSVSDCRQCIADRKESI